MCIFDVDSWQYDNEMDNEITAPTWPSRGYSSKILGDWVASQRRVVDGDFVNNWTPKAVSFAIEEKKGEMHSSSLI